MDATGLVLAIIGLLLGGLLGWLIAGRRSGALTVERDGLAERFRRAIVDLEAAIAERDTARLRIASLEADQAAREEAGAARMSELREAKEELSARFNEIGGKLLESAQRQFLERANERFSAAGKENELRLQGLLQPVEATLKRYEANLAQVEKDRAGSYGELRTAIQQLSEGNAQVTRETQRLANVMRSSPKARGRWGEEQLRTILESAGLAENVDFSLQGTVADGDQQLRPDCVIHLPGGRCIIVDVKCPLVAFEQAFDEEDEERRGALLRDHANAMKSYANDLGRKGYWRQFDLSPDFVIMFIPGEHFLSAAAERAPELIETAYRNGVIIASTINMLALAKVMAGMWRQEALATQAAEIAEVGKELYRRLATMGSHVARVGRNLGQATSAYNDFVGSLESQVLTQARRFETMKVDGGGKVIEDLSAVETTIRPLSKLTHKEAANGSVADAAE